MKVLYQAFLLPLVPEAADLPVSKAKSAIEEEKWLNGLNPDCWCGWTVLAARVGKAYGLHFIAERFDRSVVTPIAAEPAATGHRALIIGQGGESFFVLSHPNELPLFDRLAQTGQKAALARPSLFLSWSLQASTCTGTVAPTTETGFPDQIAFHQRIREHLGSLQPSDWHMEPRGNHYLSRLRIDGRLAHGKELTRTEGEWLINCFIRSCKLPETALRRPLEGQTNLPLKSGILPARISLIPAEEGPSLVVRFLYAGEDPDRSLIDLGFKPLQKQSLHQLYNRGEGLWVVAGPTGAGKTTTLHALLRWSVRVKEKVMAIEDPVERELMGVQQVSIGNPPGLSYPAAIRAFLRQAPDCLLVGEIRDRETAFTCIQAARTGHRVLSSLHARDAGGVVRRFGDLGQKREDLEAVGQMLILQRLLPRLCPHCKVAIPIPQPMEEIARRYKLPTAVSVLWKPSICSNCVEGCQGRLGVFETCPFPLPDKPAKPPFLNEAWGLAQTGIIDFRTILAFLPDPWRYSSLIPKA